MVTMAKKERTTTMKMIDLTEASQDTALDAAHLTEGLLIAMLDLKDMPFLPEVIINPWVSKL